jgi:DNA-binding response OmpR family regulator/anti-sigma regulatory factor (Ser/Thr protein kinase)
MKKTKLLLIDDERPLLHNLKQILEFENFDVVTAGNGIEGLLQYEKEKPDLVICDIMMPDMDGYGFIKTLRVKGHTDTPFIFLTAKSDYDDLRTGMNFGADDYLVKPVKSTQLLEAVNTRLQRKREINRKVEAQLTHVEQGFRLIIDKEFFASIYDIISYLHLLKAKHNQKDAVSVDEYIEYMEKSTNRLLEILQKVKSWQDQEQQLFEHKNSQKAGMPVKQIFENIAKTTAANYGRERDLICNIDNDANLNITEELLQTLLTELLDNAFKFSEKGNPVVVGGTAKKDGYSIIVADCGKTTKADDLIAMKPLHNNSRLPNNDPGIGLGLAIAELVVKSVEGKIEFTDNKPCGILVTVALPYSEQKNNVVESAEELQTS